MPKSTFFNLPQPKRKLIEQAALDEFSEYGYDASNINRIVAAGNISKGSFYQYFEDKKDLYFHLFDTLVTLKMAALEPVLSQYAAHSFSHNLNELFRLGLAFADSDLKLYRLGEDFTKKKPEFMQEFAEKYNPAAQDVYGMLLENASQRGELRPGLDLTLTSHFIHTLTTQITMGLIGRPKESRDYAIQQLLLFIERAVLAPHNYTGRNTP